MYTLINAGPSPYGRKVSVALYEKGLPFRTIFDLPWAEAVETRQHSPLEQLPILIPSVGDPIYDSCFIIDWLEWTHPECPLLPTALEQRIVARQLQVLGERLMEIAQSIIFESQRAAPAAALLERQSRKIVGGLQAAEAMFAQGIARLEGERPHIGEIAVATTLLCWEFVIEQGISPPLDILDWRGRHPELKKRIGELSCRESFRQSEPRPMPINVAGVVH